MTTKSPQHGKVIFLEGTSKGIKLLQGNKTAIVNKFTADSRSQAPVEGVQKLQDAFDHFQPHVEVTHLTENGEEVNETIFFQNLMAFSIRDIINHSTFLQALQEDKSNYQSLIDQLISNKAFQKLLADPHAKQVFIDTLNIMATELDDKY